LNKLKNKKILHLINCNTKGGVEVGALKAKKEFRSDVDYNVKFIYNKKDTNFSKIIKAYKLIKNIICIANKNEEIILISSLWLAHIVAFFVSFSNDKILWISFIHSSSYSTLFNQLICTKLTKFSDKIIFDSLSTSNSFYNNKKINKNIVNYVFRDKNIKNLKENIWKNRYFDFIMIGRNIDVKGYQSLEIFLKNWILKYNKKPKFLIITDSLIKNVNLKKIKKKYKNNCEITFKTNISNDKVLKLLSKSKFYLCLSKSEGFGMSISEAIMSGCYIITTNVGEQRRYLLSNRRTLINDFLKCDINFNKLEKIGGNKSNFLKAKKFFFSHVKYYTDGIIKSIH